MAGPLQAACLPRVVRRPGAAHHTRALAPPCYCTRVGVAAREVCAGMRSTVSASGSDADGRTTTALPALAAPRLGKSAGRAATDANGPPPVAGTPSSVRLADHVPPRRESTS